jgi:hypothetical protein
MAEAIYLLCALTSIACAVLLLRGYGASGNGLLLWSGLCFLGLAANNVLLVVDVMVVPTMDLMLFRGAVALGALMVLLFGLVWHSR